jgi:hypothetical protein
MLDANKFNEKANSIYEAHKEEWGKLYDKKIIAIDIDANDFASVGDSLRDVGLEARKKRPGHHFFVRRVGKNPVALRIRNRNHA